VCRGTSRIDCETRSTSWACYPVFKERTASTVFLTRARFRGAREAASTSALRYSSRLFFLLTLPRFGATPPTTRPAARQSLSLACAVEGARVLQIRS
jgi:hypothetical protein